MYVYFIIIRFCYVFCVLRLFGQDLLKIEWCRKFGSILNFTHHFIWKFILKLPPSYKDDFKVRLCKIKVLCLIIMKVQINKKLIFKMGLFQNIKLKLWLSKLKDTIKFGTVFWNESWGGVYPSPCVTVLPDFRFSYYFYRRPENLFLNLGPETLI